MKHLHNECNTEMIPGLSSSEWASTVSQSYFKGYLVGQIFLVWQGLEE